MIFRMNELLSKGQLDLEGLKFSKKQQKNFS